MRRAPCAVRRAPCAVRRAPCAEWRWRWRVRDVATHSALTPQSPLRPPRTPEGVHARDSFLRRLSHDLTPRHAIARNDQRIVTDLPR
ncbi:hypothetical protein FMEAI12_6450004 [Parafrankia sp. Ea1.12]|nr:hypothetical protein FMEAI12_6450004 [Parafrankia sp. Ea1.12]